MILNNRYGRKDFDIIDYIIFNVEINVYFLVIYFDVWGIKPKANALRSWDVKCSRGSRKVTTLWSIHWVTVLWSCQNRRLRI